MEIKVLQNILGANEAIAAQNRQLLDEHKIAAINFMSSPGAGKTSLLLQTIKNLKSKVKIGVIEGDVASKLDSDKIKGEGVAVIQISTGSSCSLEAHMISLALKDLPLTDIDLLFIENVGNLICPAEFALGEHKKVVISSVPEGDDKPTKYPLIFTETDVVVINKLDLLPYVDFNLNNFRRALKGVNPKVKIFEVSCKTGEGLRNWYSWLLSEVKAITTR